MTLGSALKFAEAQMQTAVDGGVTKLILDLTAVDYADSAGLGLLVHTFGRMNEKGGTMRLCGVQGRVLHMLKMTKTDSILPLDAGRAESLAALGIKAR